MASPSIRAFVGLDGGASKTKVLAIDVDGRPIGEGVAGPGSLTLCPKKAARNCRQAVRDALAGSGIELNSCRLVCGLAGHRQLARRLAFEQHLDDVGSLEVMSDGYAALLGAHHGEPGAIVITGTGSVGLSLGRDGQIRQVGGLGPVVGDEGSGNWMGRKAVRAALRSMDEAAADEGAVSLLSAALIDLMGGHHEAILDWIANADATRFADLVPLILHHDSEDDPSARRLLDAAGEEACRLIHLVGRHGDLPVTLLGGLAGTLVKRLPPAVRSGLTPPVSGPTEGALLRARELVPTEDYGS